MKFEDWRGNSIVGDVLKVVEYINKEGEQIVPPTFVLPSDLQEFLDEFGITEEDVTIKTYNVTD